jgi:HD-GYP domain-containing protein (c-di-GMP phosphodiesterase class II)
LSKNIEVKKLDIGMILDRDVMDSRSGVILIPKGTAITKEFINKLINYKIDSVFIREEKIPEGVSNKGLKDSYHNLEDALDKIFDEVKRENKLETDKILETMNDFVDEVSKERDILTQMRLLKKKDDYTFNHSLGVCILAIALGKWLELSRNQIFDLSIAALFHDLGKLKISDDIIKKPSKLTEEEAMEMRKHSFYSYKMLLDTKKFNNDILLGVLQHHEKIDGTGYPNGVSEKDIHLYAKIISICDIYHALTSTRTYKYKDSPLRAADYLREESFTSLDSHITQVFLKNISRFYVGNTVLLSDGTTGVIVYIHPQDETKPIVKVGDKFIDFLKEQEIEILDITI